MVSFSAQNCFRRGSCQNGEICMTVNPCVITTSFLSDIVDRGYLIKLPVVDCSCQFYSEQINTSRSAAEYDLNVKRPKLTDFNDLCPPDDENSG